MRIPEGLSPRTGVQWSDPDKNSPGELWLAGHHEIAIGKAKANFAIAKALGKVKQREPGIGTQKGTCKTCDRTFRWTGPKRERHYCSQTCARRGQSEVVRSRAGSKRAQKKWPPLTAFGKTQTLLEWSAETGINILTLRARLRRYGWPPEKALTA